MTEIVSVEEWLYGKLKDIAGISSRVYSDRAPLNTAFPYIVFQLQPGGRDVGTHNATTIYVDGTWLVRVIGQTNSFVSLETIEGLMHAAIHRQSGAPVVYCVRNEVFALTEVVEGEMYKHLGGMYRILCQ